VAACQLDSECDFCVKTGGLWSSDGMDVCRANTACAAGLACRKAHSLGVQQCKTELTACFMDPECFPLLEEDRDDCLTNNACSSYLACGATAEMTKHHPECEAVAASCARDVECLRVMDVEDEYALCHSHELCLPVLGCAFPEEFEEVYGTCGEEVAACFVDPECALIIAGVSEGVHDEDACRENELCVSAIKCFATAVAAVVEGCREELVACESDSDCHTYAMERDTEACRENELCLSALECVASPAEEEEETGGLCGEEASACDRDPDCFAVMGELEKPRSRELCFENEACHELLVCRYGKDLTEERPECLPAVQECLQDAECIWIVHENSELDDTWSGKDCEKNALCAQAKSCAEGGAVGCGPLDRACLGDAECFQAMDDKDSCSRNELCLPMLECHWREAAQERKGDCGKEAAACVRDHECLRQLDASGRPSGPRGSILDCLENEACLAYTGCAHAVEITLERPGCVDVAKACTQDEECAHIVHTSHTTADCRFPGSDAWCSTRCEENELCGGVVQCMLSDATSDGMSTAVAVVVVLVAVVAAAGLYLACICSMNEEPDVMLEKEPESAHHQV